MCKDCWEDYGSPKIINAEVLAAVESIKKVYEYACTGGALHVQLDDWNIDFFPDDDFEGWSQKWRKENIEDGDEFAEEQYQAEHKCYDLMCKLTEDERASALALSDGYFKL